MGVWKFSLSKKHEKLVKFWLVVMWSQEKFVLFSFYLEVFDLFPQRVYITWYIARQLNK